MVNSQTLWRDTLESIKVSVSPAIFSTWFSQTFMASIQKSGSRYVVEIGCSSSFVKTTIEGRYFGLLQDTLTKALNGPCDLMFAVKQNPEKNLSKNDFVAPLFVKEGERELADAIIRARIRPGFTFENFAVSSSNQMAHAAAEAVAGSPGTAYNPLFIWGGVGVSKTHLMIAVGHSILNQDPTSKILLVTGEEFTNDIVEGIRNKTTTAFRDKYRRLKGLLIDDIQFIAGKDAVQEEFFHTFNALTGAGGQVILPSDSPPSEISKLEERLKSRFEAGLIVDITNPDFELRCAITQIKANEMGINLESNEVQLIAGNVESARKIQGFLTKLVSASKLKNLSPRIDLIKEVLGKGSKD